MSRGIDGTATSNPIDMLNRWTLKWESGTPGCMDTASPDFAPSATMQPTGACSIGTNFSICGRLATGANTGTRGADIRVESGVIEDGSGPLSYSNNLDCRRLIRLRPGAPAGCWVVNDSVFCVSLWNRFSADRDAILTFFALC